MNDDKRDLEDSPPIIRLFLDASEMIPEGDWIGVRNLLESG